MRITRTHAITLNAPPDAVFPLFEPLGERHWVEGWEPRMHHPPTGEAEAGAVFTTGHGGEETIWVIAAHDPAAHAVRYVRVTPGSRVAEVSVRCEAAPGGTTRAEVTYTFTALSAAGEAYLADYTEAYYRAYVGSWETALNRYLSQSVKA